MNRLVVSSVRDTEKKIYKYQRERNSFPKIPASILECTSYSAISRDSTDLIRSGKQERSSKLFYGFNISPRRQSEFSCNLTQNYFYYLHQYQLFQVNKVDYEEHDK